MLPPEIERSPFYFAIRRPVTVTMIVVTAIVFGILSYRLLPINMMPEISYPSLTVRTEYPGAAPEEVETTVTRPIEQALGVVRHLVEMSSSSRAEYSDILLEFDWDTDMNHATQDVREKLDLVFLPESVKPPLILRYDPSLDPMLRVGLTSDSLSLLDLRQIAEDIVKRELEKLPGVAAVKVKGGEEGEIRVAINASKLDLLDLSIEQLTQRIAAENINLAGGRLKDGEAEYIIRTLNEFRSESEISEIVIEERDDDVIRLKDIARVQREAKQRTSITRVDGQESVEIEIFKESDANPISVSELVKKRIFGEPARKKDEKKSEDHRQFRRLELKTVADILTERVKIHILSDQAEFIRLAVNEVRSAALLGGLLAVLVLFLFLGRLKDTLIVAVVIPVSLVCAFAAMHVAKVSINIMSLGGLALGIGMMVDNAIVVIESIHRRREEGDKPVHASVSGTRIVGGAVTASTLTTIVVFFPIVFVTGVAGQVFGDMALTVIIALAVSLIVALFFIPMLVSLGSETGDKDKKHVEWIKPKPWFRPHLDRFKVGWNRWKNMRKLPRILVVPWAIIYITFRLVLGWIASIIILIFYYSLAFDYSVYERFLKPFGRVNVGFLRRCGAVFQSAIILLRRTYIALMRRLIRIPILVVFVFLLICFLSYYLILPRLGAELIPSISQGLFEVEFTLPVGITVEKTSQVILRMEHEVTRMPGVRKVSSRSGSDMMRAESATFGPNNAVLTVLLEPGGDLETREDRIVNEIRKLVSQVPALDMLITHPTLFTFKQPIELIIKDDNLDRLRLLSNEVKTRLDKLPMLTDIEASIRPGHPEVVIQFDRDRLSRIGLTARSAAERIKTAVLGDVPTRFREEERRIDVRVQLAEDDRESLEDLRQMIINPGNPVPVTLSDVARIELKEGPAEIRRISSTRAAIINAAVIGGDLKSADAAVRGVLDSFGLTEGYDYIISGQRREMEQSLSSLRFALFLAVFLVYVVMASQFESFRYPLLILMTIPLAVAGVFPGLLGMGIPISIMVFLGLIILAGIVVNNSIILVDYTGKLIQSGMALNESIIQAAETRFRPILMTSLTTILALLPMALGVGEGVELRRPMAVTVITGLMFATLVTLIIIPLLIKAVTKK